jgi:hypothetical protein
MTAQRCGRGNDREGRSPATRGIVYLAPTVRSLLRLLVTLAALLFPAGAAAQIVEADFDGDGIGDQVFRGAHPEDLSVVLSHAPEPQPLQLPHPVLRFTTADIDQDGDRDIVATTAAAGLDIFLNLGRGRFRAIHAAAVQQWQTGPRIGAAAPRPEFDNASDAPAGSATLRPAASRGPSPAAPVRHVVATFTPRPVSRGIDLRGPPALSFSR